MREILSNLIDNYLKSFNNVDEGWSRKKILATIIVIVVLVLQLKYIWKTQDFNQLIELSVVDFSSAAVLLGINSFTIAKRNKETKK